MYNVGPVTELSRSNREKLRSLGCYNKRYWQITAQLLVAHEVEMRVVIDKYAVGAPYELTLVAIVSGDKRVNRGVINQYVLLICDPIKCAEPRHADEIARAHAAANKVLT